MLDPYNDSDLRMTGGLRSVSEFSGDLKFHLHSRIEPEVADRWRKYDSESSLSEMSSQPGVEVRLLIFRKYELGEIAKRRFRRVANFCRWGRIEICS